MSWASEKIGKTNENSNSTNVIQTLSLSVYKPKTDAPVFTEQEAIRLLNENGQVPFWKNSPRLDPKEVKELYKLAAVVHEVFSETNTEYWIAGGTLLGAVRHKGLIPWDEDIDLHMPIENDEKFNQLAVPKLRERGYDIDPRWYGGYRIFHKDGLPLANEIRSRYPFIDVFHVKIADGQVRFASDKAFWPLKMLISELRPLKMYDYGPLKLPGPNDPIPYLNDLYGPDWDRVIYEIYDHKTKEAKNMIKVEMSEFRPLLPDQWP